MRAGRGRRNEIIGWKLSLRDRFDQGEKNGREGNLGFFYEKFERFLPERELFELFIFKVARMQRDLDLTSADAQTKSNSARYVTGFVTDFACPVFSKGHHHRWRNPPPLSLSLEFILV